MPDDLFIASILILLDRMEAGHRLVISRVPMEEGHEDHLKMEPIPKAKVGELQAIIRRQRSEH